MFFDAMLKAHGNVTQLTRSQDILFAITRKSPADFVFLVVVNTYTFGEADFYKLRGEFSKLTCIVLAGNWNAYTLEAKLLANSNGVGLLMPRELIPAIWAEEPNKYFSKDRQGNPVYYTRGA